MAKRQLRGNKEAKKPKSDMPKGHVSATLPALTSGKLDAVF